MQEPDVPAFSVESLKTGDEGAWNAFFLEYDRVIGSVVAWPKWHFESHVREDLAQTIRAEIVRCISNLKQEAQLKAFVKRICVNRCIDEVRRQSRERQVLQPMVVRLEDGEWKEIEPGAGPEFDPVTTVIAAERASSLKRVMEDLESPCRTAIRRFYVDGSSYKEMAEQEGISINTVGSRLARCLEKLRKLMKRDPSFADL